MNKIFIIGAKRTPIGKFLGSLYEQDLSSVCVDVVKNLISSSKINPKEIKYSVFGNVYSSSLGQGISRKISLNAGLPMDSVSYSVNMVCGSGMQAINLARDALLLEKEKIVLCGGFDFMSNVPYATDTYLRFGKKFGDFKLVDLITKDGLYDSFSGVHMGITAENIAKDLKINRKEQDDYALIAHRRAREAVQNGIFNNEIVKIHLKDYKNNDYVFSKDEFPKNEIELSKLRKLKPFFIKDSGTVTAGNTSGINDGAAFLLLANEKFCKSQKINHPIEIISIVSIGCDPQKMGLGPFFAIKKLLKQTNLKFKDINYFEINEAFSAQTLGCFKMLEKEYNVSHDYMLKRTNINGSGLGLGHPLGCSGARLAVTLYHHMLKNKIRYGIASLCIGGGMGIAMLLKNNGVK